MDRVILYLLSCAKAILVLRKDQFMILDKDNFRSLYKADGPNVRDDFAYAPVNDTIKSTGPPRGWRVRLKIKDAWMGPECIDGMRS